MQEHDEIEGERDPVHERLVAHLLGELGAEESAAVEAELEGDAGLRAKAATIEATIGLVRGLGAETPTLSDSAREPLTAAEAGPVAAAAAPAGNVIEGPWYRRAGVRAAAGVLVIVSAAVAWQASQRGGLLQPMSETAMLAPEASGGSFEEFERAFASGRLEYPVTIKGEELGPEGVREYLAFKADPMAFELPEGSALPDLARASREWSGDVTYTLRDEADALMGLGYLEAKRKSDSLAGLEALGYSDGSNDSYRGVGDTAPPAPSAPAETAPIGLGGGAAGAFGGRSGGGGGGGTMPLPATGAPAGPGSPAPRARQATVGLVSTRSNPSGTPAPSRERLRSLGYLDAEADGYADLSRYVPPAQPDAALVPTLERIAGARDEVQFEFTELEALGYTSDSQEVLLGLEVGRKATTGEDDFKGAVSNVFGLSLAESIAEENMLGRLGLKGDRLGEALEVLGYVTDADDFDPDSAEGLVLRKRVVRSQVARQRIETLITSCRRAPGEALQDMIFRHWGTRPFTDAGADALSTFAIDTDTASYTLARGMFERGMLPEAAQIRTEEFVNYFDPEVPAPVNETFGITTEIGTSPFGRAQGVTSDTLLMRVVVRAKDVALEERTPLSLTFVVDVSGSMDTDNRIGLVKDALKQLQTRLDGRDRVAIVAFSNEARTVLEPTPANQRGRIEAAIDSLSTGGGTNANAGIVMGYGLASQHFDAKLNNRVVFLSDGVANIGDTEKGQMIANTAEARAKGVYLNTVGFGIGNHNDALLEQLADDGDGVCNYVDSPVEARKAFVENFTGSFETVARDAKIQVEFDPAKVGSYRLLGYENRAIADREFRQDAVDAGEVQAGRSAVALYELRDVDLAEGPLATVRVRYKQPFDAGRSVNEEAGALEIEHAVTAAGTGFDFGAASQGFRKAALVAQAAEVLRRSLHARGDSMAELMVEIERLADASSDPDFNEFATLMAANREAIEALVEPASEGSGLLDELKYLHLELEREREAEGQPDAELIEGLERRIDEAEARMRELAFGPR